MSKGKKQEKKNIFSNVTAILLAVGAILFYYYLRENIWAKNPFHDVTTNPSNPPHFLDSDPPYHTNHYPDEFKTWQLEVYPELKPKVFTRMNDASVELVWQALMQTGEKFTEEHNWKTIAVDKEKLGLQLLFESRIGQIPSDIIVQITDDKERREIIVNMRIKCRLYWMDFGWYKHFINIFLEDLERKVKRLSRA